MPTLTLGPGIDQDLTRGDPRYLVCISLQCQSSSPTITPIQFVGGYDWGCTSLLWLLWLPCQAEGGVAVVMHYCIGGGGSGKLVTVNDSGLIVIVIHSHSHHLGLGQDGVDNHSCGGHQSS